jgi:hypothetical protein
MMSLEHEDAEVRAVKAERERDEARRFGEDAATKYNDALLASRIVTCAFCGHEYPRGTPRHGDGELSEHIKVCPKHPMRDVERERDEAKKALAQVLYHELLEVSFRDTIENLTHERDEARAKLALIQRAFSCCGCPEAETCRSAWDGYNIGGECLESK